MSADMTTAKPDLQNLINRFLTDNPGSSPAAIVEYVKTRGFPDAENATINRILYAGEELKQFGRSSIMPPKWHTLAPLAVESKLSQPKTCMGILVVIDLGNVHDVLPYVEKYLDYIPQLEIMAFADYAYNHYKPQKKDRLHYWQNASAVSETTDAKLMWDVSRKLSDDKPYRVYLMSKDKGVTALEVIINSYTKSKCSVVNSWFELRMHIE